MLEIETSGTRILRMHVVGDACLPVRTIKHQRFIADCNITLLTQSYPQVVVLRNLELYIESAYFSENLTRTKAQRCAAQPVVH